MPQLPNFMKGSAHVWSVPCENVSSSISADSKGQDQPAHLSDPGLHCPLRESLNTTEYMNGE